jgi:hypothetical protein
LLQVTGGASDMKTLLRSSEAKTIAAELLKLELLRDRHALSLDQSKRRGLFSRRLFGLGRTIEDRRRSLRIPARFSARLFLGGTEQTFDGIDLSLEGFCVRCDSVSDFGNGFGMGLTLELTQRRGRRVPETTTFTIDLPIRVVRSLKIPVAGRSRGQVCFEFVSPLAETQQALIAPYRCALLGLLWQLSGGVESPKTTTATLRAVQHAC